MAKYIVIGLGNFGASLSIKLTAMGHEVIAVDDSPSKAEQYRDQITYTIAMDATEEPSLRTLPIKDADAVVVAIGEDFGASVLTTALLKKMGAAKLYSRVINEIHQTVVEGLGVDYILKPEEESADRLSKSMDLQYVDNSYELAEGYSIVEAKVPERYQGRTVEEVDFRGRYNLNIVTIKKTKEEKGILGKKKKTEVLGVISPEYKLSNEDTIVLFGKITDLETILR